MRVKLVVGQGPHKGKEIPVTGAGKYVIGRSSECHLRPASQAISKRHCALEVREGKVFAEDLNSTNGTFINEEPLKGEREVVDGTCLKVGPLDFIVRIVNDEAPPAAAAAAEAPPPARPAAATMAAPKPAPKPAEAPPVKKAPQPQPQPKPAAAKSGDNMDEDSVAAMLLDLDDNAKVEGGLTEEKVPEGSTIMDLVLPQKDAPGGAPPPYRPKDANKQQSAANTSNAAKEILDKYRRRPRS